LNLSHSNLKEISNLEYFPNIRLLNLESNHISNLSGIENCRHSLVTLILSNNKLDSQKYSYGPYLEGFINLTTLILDNNHICNATNLGLQKLPNLKYLSLRNNSLTKMDGLKGLFDLKYLY